MSSQKVLVDDETCTGVGPNKKLAKRHAAEAMLLHLGYNKPSPQPAKPAIKSADSTNGDKKVHFVENAEENGRSLNPYLTNGFSHHYQLGESTFIFRGVRLRSRRSRLFVYTVYYFEGTRILENKHDFFIPGHTGGHYSKSSYRCV